MPIVDNPTWRHWPVLAHSLAHDKQRYGQFVLFRFDPVASVAVLDDAEASRAAALLPRDWFLGIAVRSAGDELRNANGVPLLTLTIYVVGVGPTDPVSAAIPISPSAQLNDDHPPIKLDPELPWTDLYAHSFCAVVSVITRLHDGPDYFAACLTEEQQDAFVMLTVKDQYSRYDDMFAELENAEQARRATECSQEKASESGSVNGSGSDSQGCGTGSLAASSDSADFMLCEEAQAITRIYYGRNDFAELWVGPAAECPGQPASLSACDDLRADLDKITKERYDRKIGEAKARRSQMIADWNQRVREAAAVDIDGPDAEDAQSVQGDESVVPEDAVSSHDEQRASTSLSGYEPDCIETHKPEDFAPGHSPTEPQPASWNLNGLETAKHAPTGIDSVPPHSAQDEKESLGGRDDSRVSTECAGSQAAEAQVQVGKDTKLAPPEPWPQPATKGKVPAKSTTRNRLASLNRAAVKWFRSVIVRTRA